MSFSVSFACSVSFAFSVGVECVLPSTSMCEAWQLQGRRAIALTEFFRIFCDHIIWRAEPYWTCPFTYKQCLEPQWRQLNLA